MTQLPRVEKRDVLGLPILKTLSLRASFPIWAREASLARTRERAAKPRGAFSRSREAHFTYPNRRACSQATKHFSGKLYSAGNKKILIKTYESNEKYPSKSEKKISGDLDP